VLHPYVTAYLSAERHRELVAEVRRARLGRSAPTGRVRRAAARCRAAWDTVTVPAPGPRLRDYPARPPG
jgi:hypothetical protein